MSAFTLSSTFNVAQTAGLSKARAAKVRPRGDAIAPRREKMTWKSAWHATPPPSRARPRVAIAPR
jgi:hypothetical protein